jgi:muramoyltetrapeptide carboxypeptidase
MLPTLQTKDLIYICAPAKAIDEESITYSKNYLESKGFQIVLGKHLFGKDLYFSGTVEERLEDLQHGLDHPTAKVILCARGGYGCIQLLENLDWSKFEKNPKWIIGFSDITVLHLALSQKGISSLHASMPLNFKTNSTMALESMIHAISNNPCDILAPSHPLNQLGTSNNIIVGGNLAIIHAMLNFTDLSFFDNKILFIEDVGEHLYQIDRMLYGLKFFGVFEKISGLMIGSFTSISDTEKPYGNTLEEIIHSHIKNLEIPVGFGFPCGHQDDNQAIIMGQKCFFKVTNEGATLTQQGQNSLS